MAMSVGASRNLILSRRTGGVGDLSETTFDNAELTLEQVIENGIYKVNCTHQVGIATATEVGLAFDRYPIRVILAADAATVPVDSCQMCASYWKVCNAAGEAILFARKPLASEIALVALYDRVQGLDDRLWNNYIAMNYTVTAPVATNEVAGITERLYGNLMLPNPTAEQIASITGDVDLLISTYRAAGMAPRFKVAENAYLIGEPHGRTFGAIGALSADTVAAHETLLCAKLNRDRMAARPDNQNLKAGIYTLGGMCVAAMFRSGLFESFEHREFYTVICTPTPNVAGSYTVAAVRSPQGAPPLTSIALSSNHSITGIKVSRTMAELANAMVVGSGLMHYLFNHTTGGQTVSGVLLSTMAMYKFITAQTVNEDQLKITNVIYEALHPSNKRAIANIFFDRSRVVSHGRCVTAPKYSKFELDSFMALRANPHPAGSHKAALCLLGLKRVCQSGLAVFLPWSDQLTNCITICEDVLRSGARAHIGSAYYTGEPPMVQSSTLDQYLPEIAQYIHTFNKGDSLSMSPHLSAEVARRAAMNWQNLLKDIKAKDVSATAAETVRTYLSAAGGAYLNFNPEDQATWGAATETVRGAMNRIDAVFT